MPWLVLVLVVALVAIARPAFAVKSGAVLGDSPEIVYARNVLARIWSQRGYKLTVTSGRDGEHSDQSLHYYGLAEDYRTYDIPEPDLSEMITEGRAALPGYDLVKESTHLHVEWDPK